MNFKKISALFMSAVLAVTVCGCKNNSQTSGDTSSIAQSDDTGSPDPVASGSFRVDGTKLLDAKGNEFVMRGINHAHAWYKGQLDTAIDSIAKTGANSVRVVLADGDQWDKTSVDEVERTIQRSQGLLDNAADYWIEIKDVLNAHTDTVIVNIANEWVGQWAVDTWKKGYTSVIPRMREAGIKNTIMVDAAGWGQYGESIKKAGKEVFESDPDKNTMFSIHMYGSAGKNQQTITANLKGATDQGLCVIVGEFGYNHSDGDVDEAFIMKYCTENNIG